MTGPVKFAPPRPLETAVLFLVFNRPGPTKRVFEAIREAKPPRLYVGADGARSQKKGEHEKVTAVRNFIMENIDWECEVKTLFRDQNLGCKYAVSEAITWFFENEDQGIILEDDCLPSQSFFYYCEDLLNRYSEDQRVFLVSGYNKAGQWGVFGESYFFSNYGGIWGWASWSRAWKSYDVDMKDIDAFINRNHFEDLLGNEQGRIRKNMIYNSIRIKKMDTWDYQWAYARHKNNGLACVPVKSLVENIGFGNDATHTKSEPSNKIRRQEIDFPIQDNPFLIADRSYDRNFIAKPNLMKKAMRRLLNWRTKSR